MARAWAWLGVTIVNAVAAFKGATLAISRRVYATLLDPSECSERDLPCNAVREVLGRGFRVRVESEAPFTGGVKTSSAVANASILAAYRLAGIPDPPPNHVVDLNARVSLRLGVSVTGAADDAYASLLGGVCIVDNASRRLVRRLRPPKGLAILVYRPRGLRRLWPPARPELREYAARVALEAWLLALQGDILEAFELNWLAYREYLGAPEEPARKALEAGAVAAGLTGLGPSYAAFVEEGRVERVAEAVSKLGEVIVAEPASKPACCITG